VRRSSVVAAATGPAEPRCQVGEVTPVRLHRPRRAPGREQREEAVELAVRASRSRVRPVVDAAETPAVDVAVDLRRRQRAVAEQLLDHAQVGAALEQVGRERVAETVRVRRQTAQGARVEAAAARGEEEASFAPRAS
jgi:hypothetical protein